MKMGGRRASLYGALLAGISFPISAEAQVAPIPGQVAPTREEITRGDAAPPPRARLSVEGDIERAPCALADPAYRDIQVSMSDVQFGGLGDMPAADLRPAFARYLGKAQPISVLCDVRDAAATILRQQGYLAAVQVPTQRIENGVVRFEVLFARVTKVRVLGDAGRAERLLAGYLDRLTADPVFNRNAAERYLLLARDLPGYDVKLALRPAGTGAGDLIGEVTVRRTPIEADFNIQNFAGRDTGRWGGQLRAQFFGLTGLGDRTSVSYYNTADFDEQRILQLAHDFRIGREGLTLGGQFTHAWTRPDTGPGGPDVRARTLFASVEAGFPFIRSQGANLRGALGLDLINQRVRFAGLPLSEDKLRVAYLRLNGDAVDIGSRTAEPAWRVAGTIELRQGLDILGASKGCRTAPARCSAPGAVPPSRFMGDPTATVLRFGGIAEYRLAPALTFALQPRAQYAFKPLLSFEEYSAGNYTIGRGYDPGALIGDSGLGFQAELRGTGYKIGSDFVAQPFVFADSAWIWNKDPGTPGDPERLTSFGAGARTTWRDRVRLDIAFAVPTDRVGVQARRGDPRLLISLTTKLWPWGAR